VLNILRRLFRAENPIHEAVGRGRRALAWSPANPGAVAALLATSGELRTKSRDLVRRNAWANANGNPIRAGIEFDRLGRRVAYHLYSTHPEDGAMSPMSREGGVNTLRIDAREVIHLFWPLRSPGAGHR
jgi:capsid protein